MKQIIKKLNVGNIVKDGDYYYTIFESGAYKKSGLAMGYSSDKNGIPLKEANCWFRAFHDFTYKELRRAGNISLAHTVINVNGEEFHVIKTSNKMYNTKLSLYDGRWQIFSKYASKAQHRKFNGMEAINAHYSSAEFVDDVVKNLKKHLPELKVKRIKLN